MRCTLSKEIDFPPTLGELQAALVLMTESYVGAGKFGPQEPTVRMVQGEDNAGASCRTDRGVVVVEWWVAG